MGINVALVAKSQDEFFLKGPCQTFTTCFKIFDKDL